MALKLETLKKLLAGRRIPGEIRKPLFEPFVSRKAIRVSNDLDDVTVNAVIFQVLSCACVLAYFISSLFLGLFLDPIESDRDSKSTA